MPNESITESRRSEPLSFGRSDQPAAVSAHEVVRAIYNQILKRAPDLAGSTHYVAQLENGTATVRSIVADLLQSDEWRIRFIEGRSDREVLFALYETALARAPDVSGLNYLTAWMPRADWRPIIAGFVEGAEYVARFGDDIVPGAQLKFASAALNQAPER